MYCTCTICQVPCQCILDSMSEKHLEIQMPVLCFSSLPRSAPTEPEGEGGQFKHREKEIVSVRCSNFQNKLLIPDPKQTFESQRF